MPASNPQPAKARETWCGRIGNDTILLELNRTATRERLELHLHSNKNFYHGVHENTTSQPRIPQPCEYGHTAAAGGGLVGSRVLSLLRASERSGVQIAIRTDRCARSSAIFPVLWTPVQPATGPRVQILHKWGQELGETGCVLCVAEIALSEIRGVEFFDALYTRTEGMRTRERMADDLQRQLQRTIAQLGCARSAIRDAEARREKRLIAALAGSVNSYKTMCKQGVPHGEEV